MKKLLELLKSLGVKWRALSFLKKALTIAGATLIAAVVILIIFYSNKVTYKALFYNLDSSESANILEILEQKGVSYKVAGDTVYVPEDMVDKLRITIYSDEYSSSKGYELFDESTFGLTDTEASVMYQRALETELARTISSIDGIKRARVHLVLPEDSVFVSDTKEATASITLKLQAGFSLDETQVEAIISMVSGSVENLPKQNVQVIDNNLHLLSDGIYDETSQTGVSSTSDQQEMAAAFEKKLEKEVVETLEAIFGNGNVKSTVNADMNFDSTKITEITYDPSSVIRSQTNTKENSTNGSGAGTTDTSPVDNNMQNTTGDSEGLTAQSSSETTTTNYEIPQKETVTIKAPGEVKRMTVSVVIDGTLSEDEKASIRDIVAASTGYKEDRGDIINVAAYTFNTDLEDKAQSDLDEMMREEEKKALTQKYAAMGVGAFALIILIIVSSILISKRVKKKMQKKMIAAAGAESTFEAVIGDAAINPQIIHSQPVVYDPILPDNDDIDMTLEKEIKNYAGRKPDQAIDVIKSWLSEDER